MCGIFAFVSKKGRFDAASFLIEGLRRLEYRGYDSWGIAFGEVPHICKEVGKISDAHITNSKVLAINQPAYAGLGHTRWATHGGVTVENAHPHLDCTGRVVVVHNGIIENWEELRSELWGKGHEFRSDTDTEVVAHLIESELGEGSERGELSEAVRRVFNRLGGLNAVAVFFPKESLIVAFRNGSPLVVGVGPLDLPGADSGQAKEFYIASDIPAFLPYTRQAVFLDDGEGAVLGSDGLWVVSSRTGKRRKPVTEEIAWRMEEADKGNYPHFLIKEIKEQPEVLARIAECSEEEVESIAALVKDSPEVYFTACGTAAHAALAAAYFFARIAKRHANFSVGSEFYFFEDFLNPESVLVVASQSGETMDTLEAVRVAKRRRAKVLALCNVPGSTLTRLADKTLMLSCGPEKAVLATKSYTAKLAIFLILAYQLAGRYLEGRRIISEVANGISDLFSRNLEEQVRTLAKRLHNTEHIYAVGRGVNYATALESALKIKEASYIHAEGFAGGELKHGVIALIDAGTPCLVFVANDETKRAALASAKELKSRGGFIIGISPEGSETFDEWVEVPDFCVASPIVNIVPVQLLAYHLALARSIDPDKPRNLAKSVTVK